MNDNTDTPRTDAFVNRPHGFAEAHDFARELERDRAELRAALEAISAIPINATLTAVDMQNIANRALFKVTA